MKYLAIVLLAALGLVELILRAIVVLLTAFFFAELLYENFCFNLAWAIAEHRWTERPIKDK